MERNMKQREVYTRTFRNKNITAVVEKLDYGIVVTISGGDKSHVGAVSIMDEKGKLSVVSFPDHMDQFVGNLWAKKFYEMLNEPVVVTTGIHYDCAVKEEIVQVQVLCEEMLETVLDQYEKID